MRIIIILVLILFSKTISFSSDYYIVEYKGNSEPKYSSNSGKTWHEYTIKQDEFTIIETRNNITQLSTNSGKTWQILNELTDKDLINQNTNFNKYRLEIYDILLNKSIFSISELNFCNESELKEFIFNYQLNSGLYIFYLQNHFTTKTYNVFKTN